MLRMKASVRPRPPTSRLRGGREALPSSDRLFDPLQPRKDRPLELLDGAEVGEEGVALARHRSRCDDGLPRRTASLRGGRARPARVVPACENLP